MALLSATAIACPNIAFVKYWGDVDASQHIPANGSISMNLAGLFSRTTVTFDPTLQEDLFALDGEYITGPVRERVAKLLNRVRSLAGISISARVSSLNNFPSSVGIASSASGFAALAMAATHAAGLQLDEKNLSRLARTGSGSACRSIPAGFVEWLAGTGDLDSYAYSIASPGHWHLADCIAIVSQELKPKSSILGHSLAQSSLFQPLRVLDTPRRLELCRAAIQACDFEKLADVVELDSNLMHAVMITSSPPLYYWLPATITVMTAIQGWRKSGLPACFTIDAGPNVHVLCPGGDASQMAGRLGELPGVLRVLVALPGGPAMLEDRISSLDAADE